MKCKNIMVGYKCKLNLKDLWVSIVTIDDKIHTYTPRNSAYVSCMNFVMLKKIWNVLPLKQLPSETVFLTCF